MTTSSPEVQAAVGQSPLRLLLGTGVTRAVTLVVSAGFGLLSTRIIIQAVGPAAFGAIALVATMSALLSFADLGAGAAITNVLARPTDDDEAARTVLSSLRVLVLGAMVIATSGVVLSVLNAWRPILGRGVAQLADVNLVACLVLLLFAGTVVCGAGQRALVGAGMNDRLAATQLIAPPLAFGLVLALRASGAPAMFFALCVPAAMLVMGACQFGLAHRVTDVDLIEPLRRVAYPRRWPGARIRHTAGPMMIIMIGLPLALQSDRLVLSHAAGTEALPTYAVAAQLYAPLWAVLAAAGASLWAIFARRSDDSRGTLGLSRTVLGFAMAGLLLGVALVLAGPSLAHVISGGQVSVSLGLLMCFALLLVVQAGHLPSGMALTSPEGLRFQARCVALMLLVNLPLSWILASRYGAAGPVLASALAVASIQCLPGYVVARGERSR